MILISECIYHPNVFIIQAAEKSLNFFRGVDSKPSAETEKLDEKEKVYEKVENNEDDGLSFSDFCAYLEILSAEMTLE